MRYHVDPSGIVLSERELREQQGTDIPGTLADEREFASLKAFLVKHGHEVVPHEVSFGADGFQL